jgi:hypothetical protein
MNQGIAFARTLRALEADDFRTSKFGLLAAAILLGGWIWWMLGASVPQYESTTDVRIEAGRAIAYFPPSALVNVHPGESATVHFDVGTFPAQVQTVAADHVELVLVPNPQSPIPASPSATAEVEVSRLSPAAIALQTLTRGNR